MKALVVEDETIVAWDLTDLLGEIGYSVCGVASSVAEATRLIEREEPDVVLLDILLEGERDGIDLARKLREDYHLPFLYITAHADRNTVERAKETHPGGYIVKPFAKEDVYAALEVALINYADNQGTSTVEEAASVNTSGGLPAFRLEKVKTHIENHLDDDLTVAKLAEEAGMSKYYFSRLFKQSVGMPPYQYVLERRVETVKRLLRESGFSIARIALQTGFSSHGHLSNTFNQHVGVSPSDYRDEQ